MIVTSNALASSTISTDLAPGINRAGRIVRIREQEDPSARLKRDA